ncbi:hypothetical protein M1N58_02970 [Dehalococcoidales bacterium]|nr:hypothetical protein [Dehalococcoidales bacterium]
MGRKYTQPTPVRDRQCPKCGLWFTYRGLNGHLYFRHGIRPSQSSPQPRFEFLESKDIACLKQVLDDAKHQMRLTDRLDEETKVKLFGCVLIGLGELLFGDKAIPLERLDEAFALKLKADRVKKMEQLADKAEAETKRLRQQTP